MVAILLIGASLRWATWRVAQVAHFDEGVYASNVWFDADARYRYPARHLYAPPLLPAAIELSGLLASTDGRPSPWTAQLPGVFCGLLTIPLMWRVGREWFGPRAGLTAALLVATSPFHVNHSVSALTDVPLCCLLVAALGAIARTLERPTLGRIVVASLLTATAWGVKYNGWLPPALATAGVLLQAIAVPAVRPLLWRRAATIAAISLGAFVAWSPILYDLQADGGYAAVAANHRQYVTGFSGMGRAIAWQATVQCCYSSFRDVLPIGLIAVAASLRSLRCTSPARIDLVATDAESVQPPNPIVPIGCWIALGAWSSLSFLTLLYTPYPRLLLPWLICSFLLAGAAVERLRRRPKWWGTWKWTNRWERGAAVVALLCGVAIAACPWVFGPAGPLPRNDLRRRVETLLDSIRRAGHTPERAIIYVAGEPAVFYHVRSLGWPLAAPIQNLSFADAPPPVPVYLFWGPHAARTRSLSDELEARESRFATFGAVDLPADGLTSFDRPFDLTSQDELQLYRLRTTDEPGPVRGRAVKQPGWERRRGR